MNQVTEFLKDFETKVKVNTKNFLKIAFIAVGSSIVKKEWLPIKVRYAFAFAVIAVMITSCSSSLSRVTVDFESNTSTPISRASESPQPPLLLTLTAMATARTPEATPTAHIIIAESTPPSPTVSEGTLLPIQIRLTELASGHVAESTPVPVLATSTTATTATTGYTQPNTPAPATNTPLATATLAPTATRTEIPAVTPSKQEDIKTSYTLTAYVNGEAKQVHQLVLPNAKCGIGVILAPGIYNVKESDLKFHKQLFEQRIGYNETEDAAFIAKLNIMNMGSFTINGYVSTESTKVFLINYADKWLLIEGNLNSYPDLSTLTTPKGFETMCVGINQGFGARITFLDKFDALPQLQLVEN